MICGQEYEYDGRRCVLPKGHVEESHMSNDGFLWVHHEELLFEGTDNETLETWDETVE